MPKIDKNKQRSATCGKLFSLQAYIKKVLHQTDTTLFRIVSDISFLKVPYTIYNLESKNLRLRLYFFLFF